MVSGLWAEGPNDRGELQHKYGYASGICRLASNIGRSAAEAGDVRANRRQGITLIGQSVPIHWRGGGVQILSGRERQALAAWSRLERCRILLLDSNAWEHGSAADHGQRQPC